MCLRLCRHSPTRRRPRLQTVDLKQRLRPTRKLRRKPTNRLKPTRRRKPPLKRKRRRRLTPKLRRRQQRKPAKRKAAKQATPTISPRRTKKPRRTQSPTRRQSPTATIKPNPIPPKKQGRKNPRQRQYRFARRVLRRRQHRRHAGGHRPRSRRRNKDCHQRPGWRNQQLVQNHSGFTDGFHRWFPECRTARFEVRHHTHGKAVTTNHSGEKRSASPASWKNNCFCSEQSRDNLICSAL